jgi:hypothetical protein
MALGGRLGLFRPPPEFTCGAHFHRVSRFGLAATTRPSDRTRFCENRLFTDQLEGSFIGDECVTMRAAHRDISLQRIMLKGCAFIKKNTRTCKTQALSFIAVL